MKKPSDEFRVDETMDLLSQVPGMAFVGKDKTRMTGGSGRRLDTRMQVEDTNKTVEKIVGGGLSQLNESGPKAVSHGDLFEASFHKNWHDDDVEDFLDQFSSLKDFQDYLKTAEGLVAKMSHLYNEMMKLEHEAASNDMHDTLSTALDGLNADIDRAKTWNKDAAHLASKRGQDWNSDD